MCFYYRFETMLSHSNQGNEGGVTSADRLALKFQKEQTIREDEEKPLQVGADYSRGKKMRERFGEDDRQRMHNR